MLNCFRMAGVMEASGDLGVLFLPKSVDRFLICSINKLGFLIVYLKSCGFVYKILLEIVLLYYLILSTHVLFLVHVYFIITNIPK